MLERHGVSLAEHYVLCSVDHRIGFPPERLAAHTEALVEGDPRGTFSRREYLDAIGACIAKGWLRVLTPEDCRTEAERRRRSQLPELSEEGAFQPGDADFTEPGYLLFRRTLLEIFGPEHLERSDSGWNLDEARREFRVLAPTEAACRWRVEELSAEPSMYVGEEVELVRAGPPEPIGSWKPNPFLTLSHGFQARITYRPLRFPS